MSEFHVTFQEKKWYHINCKAMSAISAYGTDLTSLSQYNKALVWDFPIMTSLSIIK